MCYFYSDKVAGPPTVGSNINENNALDKST